LIFELDFSLYTLLVNADQADLEFSFQFQNNTKDFAVAIHVASDRHGLFFFEQLGKNSCQKSHLQLLFIFE